MSTSSRSASRSSNLSVEPDASSQTSSFPPPNEVCIVKLLVLICPLLPLSERFFKSQTILVHVRVHAPTADVPETHSGPHVPATSMAQSDAYQYPNVGSFHSSTAGQDLSDSDSFTGSYTSEVSPRDSPMEYIASNNPPVSAQRPSPTIDRVPSRSISTTAHRASASRSPRHYHAPVPVSGNLASQMASWSSPGTSSLFDTHNVPVTLPPFSSNLPSTYPTFSNTPYARTNPAATFGNRNVSPPNPMMSHIYQTPPNPAYLSPQHSFSHARPSPSSPIQRASPPRFYEGMAASSFSGAGDFAGFSNMGPPPPPMSYMGSAQPSQYGFMGGPASSFQYASSSTANPSSTGNSSTPFGVMDSSSSMYAHTSAYPYQSAASATQPASTGLYNNMAATFSSSGHAGPSTSVSHGDTTSMLPSFATMSQPSSSARGNTSDSNSALQPYRQHVPYHDAATEAQARLLLNLGSNSSSSQDTYESAEEALAAEFGGYDAGN
ncbi:hypothetical protein C8Q76DRAFT_693206 [Earliella scabrosa]|nr:hypothetical protein C8Q76DRAFT_693206 [Earliella scabrosa]